MNSFGWDAHTQMLSIKWREAELIHEAKHYRLATAHPREPADDLATRLLNSIRAGVGRPFASIRRSLSGVEAPCDDACPDGAPC